MFLAIGCGDNYKTPADVKDSVAWLDAESALPVFPFGTNPIYMYVNSNSSHICQSMNDRIFARPEIIKYLNNNFTCISIIPEEIDTVRFMGRLFTAPEFFRTMQIESLPAHYFFNKFGDLKGVRSGYIDLREFKQLVKYIAEGHVEKMDFQSFLGLPESRLDTTWGDF